MFRTISVKKTMGAAVLAGACAWGFGGQAMAGGMYEPPAPAEVPPAPAAAGPELSANIALTSDYVFRGVSQTDEGPAVQGGFDVVYSILYAGVWASNLDFGGADTDTDGIPDADVANIEMDWYAGIKKEFSGVEVDLGVIYYAYPNAFDGRPAAELDYVEFKGGLSGSLAGFDLGFTMFFSPEYTAEVGENWVFEGSVERALPDFGPFSPSVSALVAYNDGEEPDGGVDYWYWNAGLSLGFLEHYSFDVRYWDTDIGSCGGRTVFQCDERVVATIKGEF